MILALGLLVAIAGCAGGSPGPSDGRLRVVATTTQVGEAAREVGGDEIQLTVLLSPGAEAHEFEITPPVAAAIERSDLILESGAGLESWIEGALATIGGQDRLRDMSSGVALRAPDDPAEAGEVDPHWWLNAPNAIRLIENVRDALGAARPDLADGFADRAAAYVARLQAADVEIRRLMGEIPPARRGIVTNHDALGYFMAEYSLRFVGSVFPSLDVSSEPDPAQLAALADTIRSEGVIAIFSESAVNPRLARAIADESGARVVDEPLYTDSLGPPGSAASTLDGMLLHDARVIHDALVGG
ncbi:MAG: metal ABC transporter substrate-binding protein [Chloroflexota bacterium]|nr:metal ABC transporter substrate-binding protein [Chloroflexota bacterium]